MASAEHEPEPPAGSRGRAPGQGVRGRSPPEAASILVIGCPTEPANFAPFQKCICISTLGVFLLYGKNLCRNPGGPSDPPCPFLGAPMVEGEATAWYLFFVCVLLERAYSTRTTMKRTNFPRRFDKPDLNFQKVYTQPKLRSCPHPVMITHSRTALNFIFQHSKKPVKYNKKLSYRRGPRDASCQLKSCQLPRNSAETTSTTSPEQIEVMKLKLYSKAVCNKHCTQP